MNSREFKFDTVYMNIAKEIASLSYCVRAKVGAILVSADHNIISTGYNGTPKGFDNTGEELVDNKLVTKREVLHAESNCITKIAKSHSCSLDSKLYVTLSPCFDCAKLIVQSGIREVIYLEAYRDTSGIEFLKKCGVKVRHLHEKEEL